MDPVSAAFTHAAEREGVGLHGLVIVQSGRVVDERYWEPYDGRTPHALHSISKSFLATAYGFAVQEGLIDLDELAVDVLAITPPRGRAGAERVRLRHLLTMSGGHDSDVMDVMHALREEDWVRIFFTVPFVHPPGSFHLYNGGSSYVLSAALTARTGLSLEEFLRPRLLAPLGITDLVIAESSQGIALGSSGMRARVTDVAKLGQLYLQRGVWEGVRLLDEGWTDAVGRPHVPTRSAAPDSSLGYGYHFWPSRHGYRMDGAHGQFCLILPDQDAVVAIASGTRDPQRTLDLVWTHLLPALSERRRLGIDAPSRLGIEAGELSVPEFLDAAPPIARLALGRTLTLPPNALGIRHIVITSEGGSTRFRVTGEGGVDDIDAHVSTWVRGVLEHWPYEPELTRAARATRAGWIDEHTLEIHEQFVETAIRRIWSFTFAEHSDEVTVRIRTDLRYWSERDETYTARLS